MGTLDFEPWVVHYDKVAVRSQPTADGSVLLMLQRGDVFSVSDTVTDYQGVDWVRLPKGSMLAREKARQPEQDLMRQDGYILVEHPAYGLLVRKKPRVAVEQTKEEGMLTRAEMQEILTKSSNAKDLIIPLEAKTWSKSEFELFVMSCGAVRPKWCSIPDTNDMLNTNMKPHEVERALLQAAEWIAGADAVLVGSGAGMGVDSGLSTFRGGKAGVWPALEAVGLAYEEICDPKWFVKEPDLAWAFWNFCHEAYRNTKPHRGYEIVRTWAEKAALGAFSFTSNIDSHWAASGWPKKRIIEVHGAVAWHQCSKACCADVWEAPADLGLHESSLTHRAEGTLPKCPKCGAVARPCVQMFGGDSKFAKSRRAVQINRYDGWLKKLEARPDADEIRVVCLELGCGLTVPTVRRELESVLRRFKNARLIRVNPENPGLAKDLSDSALSLPLAAGVALSQLEPQVAAAQTPSGHPVLYILWDEHGGGVEFTAPFGTPCLRLLRLAEAESGVEVELSKEYPTFSVSQLVQLQATQELSPTNPVPTSYMWNLSKKSGQQDGKDKDSSEDDSESIPSVQTAVIKCRNVKFKHGMTPRLAARVAEVGQMLDEMNAKFADQGYQASVRQKADRRGVMQLVRDVQFQVLPKFGLSADESGVYQMQALTGLAMIGRHDISEKAGLSMHLSYMAEAAKLPQVAKGASKDDIAAQVPAPLSASSLSAPRAAEVPTVPTPSAPTPPPEPIQVTLSQFGVDEPAQLKFDLMTDTPLSVLREQLGQRLGLDDRSLQKVKFLGRMANSFVTMKDSEFVRREIMVTSLDRWTPAEASSASTAPAPVAAKTAEQPLTAKAAPRKRPEEVIPTLTLKAAVDLQKDLIRGFSDPEFQRQLKDLQRTLQAANERKFNVERAKLFLTVQSIVLPKYGFPGDQKGVFQMMHAISGHFDHDQEFTRNGFILQALLFSPLEEAQDPRPSPAVSSTSAPAAPQAPPAAPTRAAPKSDARSEERLEDAWQTSLLAQLSGHLKGELYDFARDTVQAMSPEEAQPWSALSEDRRRDLFLRILSSPLMARCLTEPGFSTTIFSMPGQRAAWSHALADPVLRDLATQTPALLARWFVPWSGPATPAATPSPAASRSLSAVAPAVDAEPLVVSVTRLGDDDPVRWSVTLTKASLVADLRRRIAEALGLGDQAARKMRFAMKRANNFVSMEDHEPVRQAMAVRGIDVWPPADET